MPGRAALSIRKKKGCLYAIFHFVSGRDHHIYLSLSAPHASRLRLLFCRRRGAERPADTGKRGGVRPRIYIGVYGYGRAGRDFGWFFECPPDGGECDHRSCGHSFWTQLSGCAEGRSVSRKPPRSQSRGTWIWLCPAVRRCVFHWVDTVCGRFWALP